MIKFPIATLSISVVIIGLFMLFGEAPATLIWQSDELNVWQLFSAHFVHIGTEHLFWNCFAFIVLGSIIEQHSIKRLMLALTVGCTAVNFYLFVLFDLSAYAGLSGALNTLLIVALYQVSKVPGYKAAAWLSFMISVTKLIYEWSTGNTVLTSLAWPAVPEAHFAGLIGGLCLCLLFTCKSKLSDDSHKAIQEREQKIAKKNTQQFLSV